MNTSTHNLCAIAQYLKTKYQPHQVKFRKKEVHSVFDLREEDFKYLLTLLMLVRKPLYGLSLMPIANTDEIWSRWLINDLCRLINNENGHKKILPMLRKEQYLLMNEDFDGKALQTLPVEKQIIYADICLKTLINRADWTAYGWHSHYSPFGDAWRHSDMVNDQAEWLRILELDCPSAILAKMADKSERTIEMLRTELLNTERLSQKRDCGPQYKLLKRSRKACFFVFKATLIFNYCRSLGFSTVAAYCWAIREVKDIPGFINLVPDDFWLEINVFYWLRANGAFEGLSENEKKCLVEKFPQRLRSYCEGCQKEKLPKFSLRYLNFIVMPNMEPDLKRLIVRLNESLANEKPLLPIFHDYFRGAL